jgi:hypothetical protein
VIFEDFKTHCKAPTIPNNLKLIGGEAFCRSGAHERHFKLVNLLPVRVTSLEHRFAPLCSTWTMRHVTLNQKNGEWRKRHTAEMPLPESARDDTLDNPAPASEDGSYLNQRRRGEKPVVAIGASR